MHHDVVETSNDRKALAREAGWGRVSLGCVFTGIVVAYGAFAVVAAVTAVLADAIGLDTSEFTDRDWRQIGLGAGVAVALVLFVSYLYGAYVAGRMARRAGMLHGFLVFALGVGVLAAAGAIVEARDGLNAVLDDLRRLGVPTSGDEWAEIGTGAGIASLTAMLLGSLIGGLMGERWHGKLLARAAATETTAAAAASSIDLTEGDENERDGRRRDDDRTVVGEADDTATDEKATDTDDAAADGHRREATVGGGNPSTR